MNEFKPITSSYDGNYINCLNRYELVEGEKLIARWPDGTEEEIIILVRKNEEEVLEFPGYRFNEVKSTAYLLRPCEHSDKYTFLEFITGATFKRVETPKGKYIMNVQQPYLPGYMEPETEQSCITQEALEAYALREPSLAEQAERWHASEHQEYADAIKALIPGLPPKKSLRW